MTLDGRGTGGAGRAADLWAAAGTADITPRWPVPLAGFAGRSAPFQRVHDRLEANVLALRQGERTAVLVSCDLLYVGGALRAGLLTQLGGALRDDQLFLAASHTHFGPMTQRGMPALGAVDDGYLEACTSAIAACIRDQLDSLAPAALERAGPARLAGWSMNRRLRRLRLWTDGLHLDAGQGPNPRGPVDPELRALRVTRPGGELAAVIWTVACHPTAFPDPLGVTAEYPGVARRALRERSGSGLPVLFFQGFAGDLRPPFARRLRTPVDLARRLLFGPEFGPPRPEEYRAWAERAGRALLAAASTAGAPLTADLATGRSELDLSLVLSGLRRPRLAAAHAVRLGPGATLVGLGAEPLVGLLAVLARCLPAESAIPVGYLDQVETYLPADGDLAAGGYEVEGFRDAFALEGRLGPGIEAAVEAVVRRALSPGTVS